MPRNGGAESLPRWRYGRRENQAFSDAFYLIMMGFLLAALLVPLMKKPPAH